MTTVSLAICAHPKRAQAAEKLATQLQAPIVYDHQQVGSNLNHAAAWRKTLDSPGEWCGVVEDDAIPHAHINSLLIELLADAPTNIVSAYLGTGRPPSFQNDIAAAVAQQPAWIISTELLHHVAVFARRELVDDIAAFLDHTRMPCDEGIGWLARQKREPIAYSMPSVFDHEDGEPMIPDGSRPTPVTEQRHAWQFGKWRPGPLVLLDRATAKYYGRRYGRL